MMIRLRIISGSNKIVTNPFSQLMAMYSEFNEGEETIDRTIASCPLTHEKIHVIKCDLMPLGKGD